MNLVPTWLLMAMSLTIAVAFYQRKFISEAVC